MLKKIVSGAQIGADQAGLEVAKKFGYATGGWMPLGFKTKEGNKPEYAEMYNIKEHSSPYYPPRTYSNVKDSTGTIRLAYNLESAGEKCTYKAIKQYKKPHIDVDLNDPIKPEQVVQWLKDNKIEILNVAGNASTETYLAVTKYLNEVFTLIKQG